MKQTIPILSLIVFLAGCTTDNSKSAMAIWKSPDALLAERLAAAQTLVSTGMTVKAVDGVLGKRFSTGRAMTAIFIPPTSAPETRACYLIYRFDDGQILLRLNTEHFSDESIITGFSQYPTNGLPENGVTVEIL